MYGSDSVVSADLARARVQLFASHTRAASETLFLLADICRWESSSDSISFIHGGAVQYDGKGILIVGGPRAGKTTLALALLAVTGGQFVGDNNISVMRSDAPSVIGWPTPLTVRRSAAGWVQGLFPKISLLEPSGLSQAATAAARTYRDIVALWPSQLRAAGIGTSPTCNISAIVFPTLAPDAGVVESAALMAAPDAAERMRAAWDVIPERRPGADTGRIVADGRVWADATFHRFTVEAYRSRIPSLMRAEPTMLAQERPCIRIEFGADRALQAASQVVEFLAG
jgi:hypothetical protein